MSEDMDISVDLILASAMPITLVMPLGIEQVQHDKSAVDHVQKKVAHITVSCDFGHAETAPSGTFFSKNYVAIKLSNNHVNY